jgi:hypothetical protein
LKKDIFSGGVLSCTLQTLIAFGFTGGDGDIIKKKHFPIKGFFLKRIFYL